MLSRICENICGWEEKYRSGLIQSERLDWSTCGADLDVDLRGYQNINMGKKTNLSRLRRKFILGVHWKLWESERKVWSEKEKKLECREPPFT